MKKIVLISILALCGFIANAQFGLSAQLPLAVGDTASGSVTVNKYITATAGYISLSVQPVITKLSGKVYGTLYLYESVDGVNYVQLATSAVSNVLTLVAPIFITVGSPCYKYKVTFKDDSTGTAKLVVNYILRKYQTQ